MIAKEQDSFVEELIGLCADYDAQSQALRSRIVELMVIADHQVAARVDLAFEVQRLSAEAASLRAHVETVERQLHRTEDALHALENTRLMRAARPVRAVYERLRRRS